MRILYGVVGEGMGHAIRSSVVLSFLLKQGHEVAIMASGRAAAHLQKRFKEAKHVQKIHGFFIVYENNEVATGKTVWRNLVQAGAAFPAQIQSYFELLEKFEPQLVITDFEAFSYWFAKLHGLPVISVDNMQILNRTKIDAKLIEGHRKDFEFARAVVKSKVPFCNHYLISTFFDAKIKRKNTTLVPPILREEILRHPSEQGDHVVVYQTAEGNDSLANTLKETKLPCRVYGMKRDLKSPEIDGALTYMPFDEAQFISDLSSCRGVISGGSFTLMSEALYLRKPVLSVPVKGQFEQVLNAKYLERLGYGVYAASLRDPQTIFAFLDRLPLYSAALHHYHQDGNKEFEKALTVQLDRAEAGVL